MKGCQQQKEQQMPTSQFRLTIERFWSVVGIFIIIQLLLEYILSIFAFCIFQYTRTYIFILLCYET